MVGYVREIFKTNDESFEEEKAAIVLHHHKAPELDDLKHIAHEHTALPAFVSPYTAKVTCFEKRLRSIGQKTKTS